MASYPPNVSVNVFGVGAKVCVGCNGVGVVFIAGWVLIAEVIFELPKP